MFVIPGVLAASSNPFSLLGDLFSKYIPNWFGNDPIFGGGNALLAYLRIGLFITLFVILFEVGSRLAVFNNRRNSVIAVSLAISALASFFVGETMYALLIATYNTVIWFIILAIPPVAIAFLVFFCIPPRNRAFITIRILLLLLAYYLFDMLMNYTAGFFTGAPSAPSPSRSLPPSGLIALCIPYEKINFKSIKKLISPLLFLALLPVALAAATLPEALATFATWGKFIIFFLIVYVVLFQLIPGGKAERKEREEKREKQERPSGEKVPFGKRVDNFVAGLSSFREKIEGFGAETRKEEKEVSRDIAVTGDLADLTKRLKKQNLSKEEKEVIVETIKVKLREIETPMGKISERIEPFEEYVSALIDTYKQAGGARASIEKLREEKIKKGKISIAEVQKLDQEIQNLDKYTRLTVVLLSKIGPSAFNKIKKEMQESQTAFVSKFEKNPDVALVHLRAMEACEQRAVQLAEELEASEDRLKDYCRELMESLAKITQILS